MTRDIELSPLTKKGQSNTYGQLDDRELRASEYGIVRHARLHTHRSDKTNEAQFVNVRFPYFDLKYVPSVTKLPQAGGHQWYAYYNRITTVA